jgi:DNA-binding CsgD family transcriptional regulator
MNQRETFVSYKDDFRTLLESSNWESLASTAQHLLYQLGLDGFMVKMLIADSIGRPLNHVLSTLPAGLNARFCTADSCGSDPVAVHVKSRSVPLTWEIDELCAVPDSPYDGLKNLGIRTGWSVGARVECSVNRIDIYSRQARDFSRIESALLMLSCYLGDASHAIWLRQKLDNNAPTLSEREQQCLRWSAKGKTSSEIGMILGISPNTVYFHLKNAALKFNVYGTRHAISRAMELRLI